MIRRADNISDATIKDARTVTVTGALVGMIPTATARTLLVQIPTDAEVEIHERGRR